MDRPSYRDARTHLKTGHFRRHPLRPPKLWKCKGIRLLGRLRWKSWEIWRNSDYVPTIQKHANLRFFWVIHGLLSVSEWLRHLFTQFQWKKERNWKKKFSSFFGPSGVVGPTPLGVDFSGLRSKLENPLDDVNCIAIRYKSHHQVSLMSKPFGL